PAYSIRDSRRTPDIKVRMYGCNRCLRTVTHREPGKTGASMYEWNTFRNLLQGEMLFARRDLDGVTQYGTEELDFSNLVAVQRHLMEVTARLSKEMAPGQPTPEDTYAVLQHAELSLQYRKALWLNGKSVGKLRARMLRTPLL
ncbi:hypothetical protein, partial [Burkholderia sp. 9779_493]|uniref:hypothetical protein n=1 Tax=Burkholderia sp. 9779_493 TaxID=2751184 RepID=UPI001E4094C2